MLRVHRYTKKMTRKNQKTKDPFQVFLQANEWVPPEGWSYKKKQNLISDHYIEL